jgi:hypothetical protein
MPMPIQHKVTFRASPDRLFDTWKPWKAYLRRN